MSQWFDIWSVEKPQERLEMQRHGLRESVEEILDLINNEIKVIPPEQIILAGISQGCATAIHVLFNSGHRLGGFVGLSGWLPYVSQIEDICRAQREAVERVQYIKAIPGHNREVIKASGNEACLETPVFLGHCKDDEVVPVMNGEALCKGLRDLGMQVEWHAYEDGGHWLNEPEGLDDLVRFLKYCSSKSGRL
jgi:predicted esterase